MVVEKETYKTTTGAYCVKPNPNKAMERADCSINCRRVIFMTALEKRVSIEYRYKYASHEHKLYRYNIVLASGEPFYFVACRLKCRNAFGQST